MKHARFYLTAAGLSLLTLAGCANPPFDRDALYHDSQYWQRAQTTEMIYQQGPKAQQMLNRDIARCISDLKELQRMGLLRNTLPGDKMGNGQMPDVETPEGHLAQWDTPERDGALRTEHMDYYDFESCMNFKGWQRIKSVPYDTAQKAQDDYAQMILGEDYSAWKEPSDSKGNKEGDFGNLNN